MAVLGLLMLFVGLQGLKWHLFESYSLMVMVMSLIEVHGVVPQVLNQKI